MKRVLVLALSSMATLGTTARAPASDPPPAPVADAASPIGLLELANGDRLQVRIERFDATEHLLVAAHPLAKTPLEIRAEALSRFRAAETESASPARKTTGGWIVEMTGEARIRAETVATDGQTVTIVHPDLGRLAAARSAVRSIRRADVTRVLYEGPAKGEEWRTATETRTLTSGMVRVRAGELIGRSMPALPRRCRVDMHLQWSFPAFVVHFYGKDLAAMANGTDNSYQLHYQMGRQARLFRIAPQRGMHLVGNAQFGLDEKIPRSTRLTLFMDLETRRVRLYLNDRSVADWTDPQDFPEAGPMLAVQSANGLLTVSRIRVSEWDGRLPIETSTRPADDNSDAIEMQNGDTVSGVVVHMDEKILGLRTPFGELSIPLEDIEHIVFHPVPPPVAEAEKEPANGVLFLLWDDSALTVKLAHIADGMAIGEVVPFGPVRISLPCVREVQWRRPPPDSAEEDDGDDTASNIGSGVGEMPRHEDAENSWNPSTPLAARV
jgi:hypothetical protein